MTLKYSVSLSEIREVFESWNGWYWFVTEYHEASLAFGLVKGWDIEWGYFDLNELRKLEKTSKVWKVPRKNWAVCPCVETDAVSCSRVSDTDECRSMVLPERLPVGIKLKGGGWKMADEKNNKETATLCFTKAGRGVKVVVDGVWFYTSKESLMDLVNGKAKACTFSTIKDDVVLGK
jgi:hypothetical protein